MKACCHLLAFKAGDEHPMKVIMRSPKIILDISKEGTYNPRFVAKVMEGRRQVQEGKTVTIESTEEQELQDLDESVENLKKVQAGELQAAPLKELLDAI